MPLSERAASQKDKTTAEGRPQLEHRHFAIVAYIISMMMPMSLRRTTAQHFAKHLSERSTKFDTQRFLRACNYD